MLLLPRVAVTSCDSTAMARACTPGCNTGHVRQRDKDRERREGKGKRWLEYMHACTYQSGCHKLLFSLGGDVLNRHGVCVEHLHDERHKLDERQLHANTLAQAVSGMVLVLHVPKDIQSEKETETEREWPVALRYRPQQAAHSLEAAAQHVQHANRPCRLGLGYGLAHVWRQLDLNVGRRRERVEQLPTWHEL